MNCFITGTDTGVGKTYVSTRLVRWLRAAGCDAVGFKPICCGGREDAQELWAASGCGLTVNEVNPVWFRPPAAPYTAAMIEERVVDLHLIRETFARLRQRHQSVVVEGVGGWLVPVTAELSMADLAAEFALPVIVVVANRLGAINHTLLTVAAIRAHGLSIAGLVFTHPHPAVEDDAVALPTNRAIIEQLTGLPVLAEFEHGQETAAFAKVER